MIKIILTISIFSLLSTSVLAEQITLLELMNKRKIECNIGESYIIKSEDLVDVTDTGNGGDFSQVRVISEFRKDAERIYLATDEIWLDLPVSQSHLSGSKPYSSKRRVIWDGDKYIEYTERSKWVLISKRKQRRDAYTGAIRGNFLDGTFPGDRKPIETILGTASKINLRSQMENINGTNCYVIEASTPHGEYSIWIDPEHGYNIAKAEVYKTGDDILGGEPISKHKIPKYLPGFRGEMFARTAEYFLSIDNVEFKKVGTVWLPISGTCQRTDKYVNGRVETVKKNYKRTHIDLNPDFEAVGAFVPDIPDGTSVSLEDAGGQGKYIWQNGQPVKEMKSNAKP